MSQLRDNSVSQRSADFLLCTKKAPPGQSGALNGRDKLVETVPYFGIALILFARTGLRYRTLGGWLSDNNIGTSCGGRSNNNIGTSRGRGRGRISALFARINDGTGLIV